MVRSLEQKRAKYAWECIRKVKQKNKNDLNEKYRSYVRSAASYIQVNGLGNTLAFYKSKSTSDDKKNKNSTEKEAYKLLYEHINGWFKEHIKSNKSNDKDLLYWICNEKTSSIEVFRVTKEIIALLNWMKRFAEIELGDKNEQK